jgi:hypothetical protein
MRFPLTFVLLVTAALLLVACDEQRAARLEEGISTEADVRREFGEPVQITERADGSKVLAYPRQPEGATNYEIGIGPDGKMNSLRQLLTPANFARVQPGMDAADVTRLLGRHAKVVRYATKPGEEVWQWRFVQDGKVKKVFEVTFDSQHKVLATATTDDERETLPAK